MSDTNELLRSSQLVRTGLEQDNGKTPERLLSLSCQSSQKELKHLCQGLTSRRIRPLEPRQNSSAFVLSSMCQMLQIITTTKASTDRQRSAHKSHDNQNKNKEKRRSNWYQLGENDHHSSDSKGFGRLLEQNQTTVRTTESQLMPRPLALKDLSPCARKRHPAMGTFTSLCIRYSTSEKYFIFFRNF